MQNIQVMFFPTSADIGLILSSARLLLPAEIPILMGHDDPPDMGLSENSVPLYTQWLMIINYPY